MIPIDCHLLRLFLLIGWRRSLLSETILGGGKNMGAKVQRGLVLNHVEI